MFKTNPNKNRDIIHVSIQSTSKRNLQRISSSSLDKINKERNNKHKPSFTMSEQSQSIPGSNNHVIPNIPSINNDSNRLNKKNIRRKIQSFDSANIFEKKKNKKKKKNKYCGLPVWVLCLLIYFLLLLMAIIAAITVGMVTVKKEKSSSISSSIETSTTSITSTTITSTTTSETTSTTASTSTSKTTSSTTSMSTTTSKTSTTTTTTVTTTTTYFTCGNFTVKANWDYTGNDVVNNGPTNFASCCAWCLNITSCIAFTFNPWNYCLIKNSTGSGGVAYPNSIGAAL